MLFIADTLNNKFDSGAEEQWIPDIDSLGRKNDWFLLSITGYRMW
jgi:hypothetical protein